MSKSQSITVGYCLLLLNITTGGTPILGHTGVVRPQWVTFVGQKLVNGHQFVPEITYEWVTFIAPKSMDESLIPSENG